VEKDDAYAKFWLESVVLARSHRFRSHQLNELRGIVAAHKTLIEEKRDEHFAS